MGDLAAASVALEKVPESHSVSTPQILRVAQTHLVLFFVGFEPGSCSAAQMGFRFKMLLLQPPGALESHTSITAPTSHGSSGIFTFYRFIVYISGWPQTLRHPRNPINLIVRLGGVSFAHYTQWISVCCWLDHLLFIQCECTEVRGVSEQRHGCGLWTSPVLGGTAALSKHFIRKEAPPGAVRRPGILFLFPVTREVVLGIKAGLAFPFIRAVLK